MLSREENELLTRVGPDTPMGRTLRRYWVPALLASEIPEPDCPPVRVRLLGEELIAFRDSQGRIGLLDELCPHRRASLYFGRNEECGLRCIYHGWKFDVTGQCTDMMNEPEEHDFSHKVRTPAYPTAELGGVIWAYLGPAEKMPPLPKFAWTQAPEANRHVTKVIQECNWLQGLEGGIDTSHAPILHRLISETSTRGGFKPSSPFVRGKAPQLVVDLTDYGYRYAGIRPLGEAELHIRSYQFIMPFHQIRPSRSESGLPMDAGHCWVPMDDQHDHGVQLVILSGRRRCGEEDRLERGLGNGPLHVDQKTFRPVANRVQRLPAGPARAAHGKLQRDRRHQRAGPRDPGEHGADRRSVQGASGTGGQGDHPGAQVVAPGGDGGGGRRRAGRHRHQLLSVAGAGSDPAA